MLFKYPYMIDEKWPSNYDRKMDALPFDTIHDILRCLSLMQSLLKDRNGPIWRIGNRRVNLRNTAPKPHEANGIIRFCYFYKNIIKGKNPDEAVTLLFPLQRQGTSNLFVALLI